jgi:hypothetical protein
MRFPEMMHRYWYGDSASSASSATSSSSSFAIPLAFLVPLRPGQSNPLIRFPSFGRIDWKIHQPGTGVKKSNYQTFESDMKTYETASGLKYPLFVRNVVRATFADSIILSDPILLIQDKGLVKYRLWKMRGAEGAFSDKEVDYSLIKKEHKRSWIHRSHVFIFTADPPLGEEAEKKLQDNEVVIHEKNASGFYGDVLLLLKSHCIQVRWGISVSDQNPQEESDLSEPETEEPASSEQLSVRLQATSLTETETPTASVREASTSSVRVAASTTPRQTRSRTKPIWK